MNIPHAFAKYLRLFANLPADSRIMMELVPAGSFDYKQQLMSRLLLQLELFKTMYYNSNRDSKKSDPMPSPEMFVPDYIQVEVDREAEIQKEKAEETAEVSRDFWMKRNGI